MAKKRSRCDDFSSGRSHTDDEKEDEEVAPTDWLGIASLILPILASIGTTVLVLAVAVFADADTSFGLSFLLYSLAFALCCMTALFAGGALGLPWRRCHQADPRRLHCSPDLRAVLGGNGILRGIDPERAHA